VSDLPGDLKSLRIDRDAPRRGPRRWPFILLLPALVALAAVWFLRIQGSLSATEVSVVQAAVAAPGTSSPGASLLTASGYVVARRQAVISSKIQGRLSELRVEEGSRVDANEIIARLEDADFVAVVRQGEAGVARARAEVDEQRRQHRLALDLANKNLVSTDEADAAQSRVRIAEAGVLQADATLQLARAQLENTVIRSPFAGVVVKKMAEVGESVAPIPPGVNISTSSGAIVAIADLATLEVEADVTESNVARLNADQPAEVTVEAFPDTRYDAILRQIIPTADRTKATVQVKVTILDEDERLKPEMSARVTFVERAAPANESGAAPAKPVVTIPASAVADRGGTSVVFEVREGRAHVRPVVTAGQRDGRVVIKQGLSGGEILVAAPPGQLADGDAVRISGSGPGGTR
jgi:RND family efflux transporter MFP subunit